MISIDGDLDTIIFNNSPHALIKGQSMSTFYGYRYLGTWKADQQDEAEQFGLQPGDARMKTSITTECIMNVTIR